MLDTNQLADEIATAHLERRQIATPSSRDPVFDLASAYAVEAELVRLRGAAGHGPVGRKVGYANKALWRVLKLDTVVWAHIYDDTVHYSRNGEASLSIDRMISPKIEPEIVFKLKSAVGPDVLDACEWIALGFEIIDCPFPEWRFQPADFVAAFGLHAALVVGEPRPVAPEMIDQLARFKVALKRNGQLVEQGSGRNVLRSPALCLSELAAAATRREVPLAASEIITTGTLTESTPIAPGETWSAVVDGIDLPDLTVRL